MFSTAHIMDASQRLDESISLNPPDVQVQQKQNTFNKKSIFMPQSTLKVELPFQLRRTELIRPKIVRQMTQKNSADALREQRHQALQMILNRRGLCVRRQIYVSEDDCTIVKIGYRMSTNPSAENERLMRNPQQLTIPEVLRDLPNDRFPLQYLN